MSFTQDVKQELSLYHLVHDEQIAQLSALIQMTSSIAIGSRTYLLVKTENAAVSRTILRSMKEVFHVEADAFVQRKMNLKKNLIYGLRLYGDVTKILERLGLYSNRGLLDKPLAKIVSKDQCAKAYLMGAFMAEGSVNSPKTSNYHLEIKLKDQTLADMVIELLDRFQIPAKSIARRQKVIVYIKAAEKIADFLRCIGATQTLFQFEDARISRDMSNAVTRLNNVDLANVVRSVEAANKQLKEIEKLERYQLIDKLDDKLKDAIELRKRHPEASLVELIEHYRNEKGVIVSKSGLNHRYTKIHEMAMKLGEEDE